MKFVTLDIIIRIIDKGFITFLNEKIFNKTYIGIGIITNPSTKQKNDLTSVI